MTLVPVLDETLPEAASYDRYGVPGMWFNWGQYYDRFNIDMEPHMPNKFGWVVEVDPRDPDAMPVKHTALGRFRHEGCETTVSVEGRLVVYSGDDNRIIASPNVTTSHMISLLRIYITQQTPSATF